MELYEIKNGLTKAHLLMTEFYQSIDIEAYRREIEGLTVITLQEGFWDDATYITCAGTCPSPLR